LKAAFFFGSPIAKARPIALTQHPGGLTILNNSDINAHFRAAVHAAVFWYGMYKLLLLPEASDVLSVPDLYAISNRILKNPSRGLGRAL